MSYICAFFLFFFFKHQSLLIQDSSASVCWATGWITSFYFPLCIKEEQKVEIFWDLSSSGAVTQMDLIRRTVSVGMDSRRCHVRLETWEHRGWRKQITLDVIRAGFKSRRPVWRGLGRWGWQNTQPSEEVGPREEGPWKPDWEFRAGRKEALQILSHRMTAWKWFPARFTQPNS